MSDRQHATDGNPSAASTGEVPVSDLDLHELRKMAEAQAAGHAEMVRLNGGIGMLGVRDPAMFDDMCRWQNATENDHADTVLALLDRLERAETERDQWHETADEANETMFAYRSHAQVLGQQLDAAEAERDALAAKLAAVRAALAGHPRCDVHPGDDAITCGWKRAVADVQAVLDGGGADA